MKNCKKQCGNCELATFKGKGVYCESKGEYVSESFKNEYGKVYIREKAITLLNMVINTAEDLTPGTIVNERYEINGDLYTEIFNFLQNNNLDNFI